MNALRKTAVWLDDRLHLTALYASTAGHEVPASAGSWFYVFGSATLLCFAAAAVLTLPVGLLAQRGPRQSRTST